MKICLILVVCHICVFTLEYFHVLGRGHSNLNQDWLKVGLTFFSPLGHSNLNFVLQAFFGKKILSDSKKKKRSRLWRLTDDSGLEIFCQTQKKSASFKNIHCKGDSINFRNLSML